MNAAHADPAREGILVMSNSNVAAAKAISDRRMVAKILPGHSVMACYLV